MTRTEKNDEDTNDAMVYSCASGMHGECAIVLEICYNVEDERATKPNQTDKIKSNQTPRRRVSSSSSLA